MIRQHIVYDSQQTTPEDRNATFSAQLLTSVVAGSVLAVSFLALSNPLALPQKAALQSIVSPRVERITVEPIHRERDWIIMTVPAGAWKVLIEEPEPITAPKPIEKKEPPVVKKKPVKEPVKPVEKPKTPRTAAKQNAGSAKIAPAVTGSGQQTNNMSNALSQIVEIIERHKQYPKRARDIGLEGTTHLLVTVNAQGSVVEFKLKDGGNALLRRATMNAARHLKGFQTAAREAATLEIPVRYEIE